MTLFPAQLLILLFGIVAVIFLHLKTGIKSWIIGLFLGLLIYPVIGYLIDGDSGRVIALGLPCPSTIFTFGFLMLISRRLPKYLLIIPSLWALLGLSAAANFGVYQDFMMILAAVVADVWLLSRKT